MKNHNFSMDPGGFLYEIPSVMAVLWGIMSEVEIFFGQAFGITIKNGSKMTVMTIVQV